MLPAGSSAFAVRGQRPSNNDAFAAKYASIEPWKSRWSCERLVNPTAAKLQRLEPAHRDGDRRCLEHARGVAGVEHAREQPVQVGRLGRRQRQSLSYASDACLDRAEQAARQARRLEHRSDQERRRRLPVGAGHAHDGHVLARPAGDHVGERPERLAYPSRAHLREPDVDERALDEQRRGPSRRGLGCQLVAVLGRPGHAGEERPGRDGVEAQREVDDLDSVEPRERLEGSAALRAERG